MPGGAPVVPRKTRPGKKRLDTPVAAAVAGRSRQFTRERRRQRVVAPFPADRVDAGQHLAVHDHAAAGTRADDDAEDAGRACGRAVAGLRQREAVGVIREPQRPLEQRRQVLGQRLAVQPRGIRVLDEPRRRRQRAGHADADAGLLPDLRLDLANQTGDGDERARVVVPRSGDPQPDRECSRRPPWRSLRSSCRRDQRRCGTCGRLCVGAAGNANGDRAAGTGDPDRRSSAEGGTGTTASPVCRLSGRSRS